MKKQHRELDDYTSMPKKLQRVLFGWKENSKGHGYHPTNMNNRSTSARIDTKATKEFLVPLRKENSDQKLIRISRNTERKRLRRKKRNKHEDKALNKKLDKEQDSLFIEKVPFGQFAKEPPIIKTLPKKVFSSE